MSKGRRERVERKTSELEREIRPLYFSLDEKDDEDRRLKKPREKCKSCVWGESGEPGSVMSNGSMENIGKGV